MSAIGAGVFDFAELQLNCMVNIVQMKGPQTQ